MKQTYKLITAKGDYDIDVEQSIAVFTSKLNNNLIMTLNFNEDWDASTIFSYILDHNCTHRTF